MAFCNSCGFKADDGVNFCPACGATIAPAPTTPIQPVQPVQQYQAPSQGYAPPPPQQQNPNPGYASPPPQYQNPNQGYAPPPPQYQNPNQGYAPPPPQYQNPNQGYAPPGAPMTPEMMDAQNGKTMAILSYIFFFVPLLSGAHKTSPFVKYHTNQGTLLFCVGIAYSIISTLLSILIKVDREIKIWGIGTGVTQRVTPGWLSAILALLCLPILGGVILGIMNAVKGKKQPLPVIGGFTIIK